MHKNHPLSPPVTSTGDDLSLQADRSFAKSPVQQIDGTVLELPPGRDGVTADIRTINRQCFLMLCNTHRGLLSSLVHVPSKLVLAARNLIQMGANEQEWALWAKTLSHYTESLTDARSQIAAAAKLHGLADKGREALKDIEAIATVLPLFLQAASHPSSGQEDIRKSAERLGNSSMALTQSLSQLLRAVEAATERAKHLDRSEMP